MIRSVVCLSVLTLAACATPPPVTVKAGPPPPATAASEVDQPPTPIGGLPALLARVEYPPRARQRGISGVVVVDAVIDPSGRVVWAQPREPVHPLLDVAAVNAVSASPFEPGVDDGQPVFVRIQVPITFRSSDGFAPGPTRL